MRIDVPEEGEVARAPVVVSRFAVRGTDALDEAQRLAIYEDVAVVRQNWDQFLRSAAGVKTLVLSSAARR